LLDAAVQLESAAFSKNGPNFAALPTEAKTIVALLIDYAGLDRRHFLRGVTENGLKPVDTKNVTTSACNNPPDDGDAHTTVTIGDLSASSPGAGVPRDEPEAQKGDAAQRKDPNVLL
jgi:hypothetical protein